MALVLLAGATLFAVLIVLQTALAFRPVADVLGQLDAPLKSGWKTVTAIAWICAYCAKLGVWLGN